jgi:hypothetical protein
MNPATPSIYTPAPAEPTAPITYTPPPIEYPTSYQPQPYQPQEYQPSLTGQNNGDINNLYINIQDYLDMLNLLYDKTKDTFISVNTVLENIKPFIYKKVDKNI